MKHPVDGLEAFIHIAELGSFNRAAEKLNITQTALSRRIQRLESYLGLKLLDRTTRVVSLTTVGRSFLPEACRLVDELEASIGRLRTQSRFSTGDFSIATVPSTMFGFMPSLLSRYAQQYPNNRINILDRTSVQVMEAVQRRQAEFGLHVKTLVHQPGLACEQLGREQFVAYCAKNHPLAQRSVVRWAELSGYDLITIGGASGNRVLMEAQLLQSGIDIHTKYVVEYFSSAIGLAREGLGVAIVVATRSDSLSPNLVQIPLIDPIIKRPLFLIKRQGESLTPAAEQLYGMIRQHFQTEHAI